MVERKGDSRFPINGTNMIDDFSGEVDNFLKSDEAEWLKNVPAWGASATFTVPIIIAAAPLVVGGLGLAVGLIATTALGVGILVGGTYLVNEFEKNIEKKVAEKISSQKEGARREGSYGAGDSIDTTLSILEQKLNEQNARLSKLDQENILRLNQVIELKSNLRGLNDDLTNLYAARGTLGVDAADDGAPGDRDAGGEAGASAGDQLRALEKPETRHDAKSRPNSSPTSQRLDGWTRRVQESRGESGNVVVNLLPPAPAHAGPSDLAAGR